MNLEVHLQLSGVQFFFFLKVFPYNSMSFFDLWHNVSLLQFLVQRPLDSGSG